MENCLLQVLFWLSITAVVYTYLGYGIITSLLVKIKGPRLTNTGDAPALLRATLIIPCFNEAGILEEKIRNTLALDYPKELLDILFVTDGSTDHSVELLKGYEDRGIRYSHSPARLGKVAAMNRAIAGVTTPITIFCDANTLLNPESIRRMLRHYHDPQVGAVSGEKTVISDTGDGAAGAGEGLYWKYESYLKKKDSELYSLVGVAGELFSVRTELFAILPENTLLDDFMISMLIAQKGYRVIYEPGAVASEKPSAGMADEWKRKVRICAGGWQSVMRLRRLLLPWPNFTLWFQYVSHRVLRWTVTPFFLVAAFPLNIALVYARPCSLLYPILLVLQCAFYLLAFAGFLLKNRQISIKGFFVPYYFATMNFATFAGLRRYLAGIKSGAWEKANRKV